MSLPELTAATSAEVRVAIRRRLLKDAPEGTDAPAVLEVVMAIVGPVIDEQLALIAKLRERATGW